MKGMLFRLYVPMAHTRAATVMLDARDVPYYFDAGTNTGRYEVVAAGKGVPEQAALLEVAKFIQARTAVPVLLAIQACEVVEIQNEES